MRCRIAGVSAAFFLLAISIASSEPLSVDAFASLPQFEGVTLSPDGRYLGAKVYRDDKYVLVIYDLENLKTKKPLVIATDPWSVVSLKWANDDRVLVTVKHALQDYRWDWYATQMTALDADGGNPLVFKPPKPNERDLLGRFFGDNIIDMLPDDPEHVLVRWNPDDFKKPRLYRMNIYTNKLSLVQNGKRSVQSWLVDQQGRVRVGGGIEGGSFRAFYRPVGSRKWKLLFKKSLAERTMFRAVLIDDADPDVAYVFSDFETDTVGLYKYRLSTASFIEEIFRHPDADVLGVIFNRSRTEILGVTYANDGIKTHWLNTLQPELLSRIQSRLPGLTLYVASNSADYRRVVVRARSENRPSRYYLYEPEQDRLQFFAHTYPQLDGKLLSGTKIMTYEARDGLEIEAFVSLPVGVSYPPQMPLPTVIMPHGGPAARTFSGFNPLVQLLTNRGYAVLQMNFRGSTGYGRKFRMAGERQWGQAMQDDITDGTKWLIDQGVADPERICIVGGSYGGYAALMGAVKTPDLFQCAVSFNGVSDLKELLERSRRFVFGIEANDFIAGWGDSAILDENSPVKRAQEIKIPILLAHSTKDAVVKFSQSEKMAKALEKAGKDYQFIRLEDGDHGLALGGVRPVFYEALVEFLDKQLH